jgi:hypothetical protein
VGGEIQLTDGIASLLRREKVFAYRYEGKRYDCGSKEGFLQANVELALAHPQVGPGFRAYLQGLEICRHPAGAPAQRRRSSARTRCPPTLLDQFVAGLAGKGLEVAHRAGVGGHHLQHLAAAMSASAFLALRMGSGQFRPRVSSSLSRPWRCPGLAGSTKPRRGSHP